MIVYLSVLDSQEKKTKFEQIYLAYRKQMYYAAFQILRHDEDAEKNTIPFGETVADFYLSNAEESSSTIMWTDPENDYLVCVDGFFSQEELIEMARDLIKAEVPKPE